MCEFCRNDGKEHTIFESDENHWYTTFLSNGKFYIFHRRRGFSGSNGIYVKNCPMCGRNLSEDDMKENIFDSEKLKKQFADCGKSLESASAVLNNVIENITKNIIDEKNNCMAMEFTRVIGELLATNGVRIKAQEYTAENARDNSIEYRYGVSITGLDFTEHDKEFKDKLAEKEKDYKTVSGLLCQCQMDSGGLKERIAELETELDIKENLLKIKNGLCGEVLFVNDDVSDSEQIDKEGLKKAMRNMKIESLKEGSFVSENAHSREWLEDRHQSDCIEINRLNTALEVIVEKYQRLRELGGL